MSILLDRSTKVIVQGITGKMARLHTKDMLAYGTNVVGGVVPGKGGETVEGIPVFNTVEEVVVETGAEASLVFVPPPFAADSIMEAADAGIRYCVCITDGIPAQDMIRVKRYMYRYPKERRMILTVLVQLVQVKHFWGSCQVASIWKETSELLADLER